MSRWTNGKSSYVEGYREKALEGGPVKVQESPGPASGKTATVTGKVDAFGNQGPIPAGDPHVKYSKISTNGKGKLGYGDPHLRARGLSSSGKGGM